MATATPPETDTLLTAEEFARRPDPGFPEELVMGRIRAMPPACFRHSFLCNRAGRILGNFAEEHDVGWVLNNDSGVITNRNPDSVRGPDVAYFSYEKVPKDAFPAPYPEVAPDLVVEVRSPEDRWSRVLAKAAEYIDAGVRCVIVLDDDSRTAQVCKAELPARLLTEDDELDLSEVLPGFRVPLRRFFG